MDEENEKLNDVTASINYKYNRNVATVYANNVLIQRGEHEFVISFFEALPFIEKVNDEEFLEKAKTDGINAECVARIVISPSFLPKLAEVLNRNLPPPTKEQIADLLQHIQSELESK